jgi:hypothetical protein
MFIQSSWERDDAAVRRQARLRHRRVRARKVVFLSPASLTPSLTLRTHSDPLGTPPDHAQSSAGTRYGTAGKKRWTRPRAPTAEVAFVFDICVLPCRC